MKVLMIIPAYNEENNIVGVIKKINNYSKYSLDYIVINDGSTDNTKSILIENNIKFIDLPCNLGIGAAVQTGYKYAFNNNYDIAIQFDGDGQHDIDYVEKLVDPIVNDNYDMVIGSRFVGEESSFKSTASRRLGIKLISNLINVLTGVRIYDVTSGFRAVNRKIIKKFSNNYVFDFPEPISNLEVIVNNYRIKEVSVKMNERKHGKSSINFSKSIYYMFNVYITILILGLGGKKKCR